jgi:hypothetical protein
MRVRVLFLTQFRLVSRIGADSEAEAGIAETSGTREEGSEPSYEDTFSLDRSYLHNRTKCVFIVYTISLFESIKLYFCQTSHLPFV